MYTLRTIFPDGEKNQSLGQSYKLVKRKDSPADWNNIAETCNIPALIIPENGEIIWIDGNMKNYIVSDSGKTFARIS